MRKLTFWLLLFSLMLATRYWADGSACTPECKDYYIQGYIQAMIDAYYQEYRVRVAVEGHTAYLYHMPTNGMLAGWIYRFVCGFPYIKNVVVVSCGGGRPIIPVPQPCGMRGVWFPQDNKLFQPLIADPRQITYSAAWRFHDNIVEGSAGAVSFGNSVPFFRWIGVTRYCCDMQLDLEGGVWAVFRLDRDARSEQSDCVCLINSDWYVGVVWTALCGKWSYRARYYHVSSHLGDEFMLEHPEFRRVNPSREAVDFFASYQLGWPIRIYGGVGYNLRSNDSFRMKHWYIEYGTEVRVLGRAFCQLGLFVQPFLAMHFRNWQYKDWDFDGTYLLGLEFSGYEGLRRKIRLFMEYHDGYSFEGQFSRLRTRYFAVRVSYGF